MRTHAGDGRSRGARAAAGRRAVARRPGARGRPRGAGAAPALSSVSTERTGSGPAGRPGPALGEHAQPGRERSSASSARASCAAAAAPGASSARCSARARSSTGLPLRAPWRATWSATWVSRPGTDGTSTSTPLDGEALGPGREQAQAASAGTPGHRRASVQVDAVGGPCARPGVRVGLASGGRSSPSPSDARVAESRRPARPAGGRAGATRRSCRRRGAACRVVVEPRVSAGPLRRTQRTPAARSAPTDLGRRAVDDRELARRSGVGRRGGVGPSHGGG